MRTPATARARTRTCWARSWCPRRRLDEFGVELEALGGAGETERPWMLSVLAGELDIPRALHFTAAADGGPAASVASIEVKADTAAGVARATALVPRAMAMAVEIPLSHRAGGPPVRADGREGPPAGWRNCERAA